MQGAARHGRSPALSLVDAGRPAESGKRLARSDRGKNTVHWPIVAASISVRTWGLDEPTQESSIQPPSVIALYDIASQPTQRVRPGAEASQAVERISDERICGLLRALES